MHQYSVYILLCSDGSYYTGITNNISRRVQEHELGLNLTCYTFRKRPLTLVYQQDFHFAEQAIAYEKQIKGWSRKKKAALIAGDIDLLSKISCGR